MRSIVKGLERHDRVDSESKGDGDGDGEVG